jgi:hypothetical protein
MTLSLDELPDDVASLKALLLAAHADNARLAPRNERLDHIIKGAAPCAVRSILGADRRRPVEPGLGRCRVT